MYNIRTLCPGFNNLNLTTEGQGRKKQPLQTWSLKDYRSTLLPSVKLYSDCLCEGKELHTLQVRPLF